MGKHRRISGVPASPNAANAAVRSTSAWVVRFALRVARGKQVKDAPSEVCSAHERGRTKICAAHRCPEIGRRPHIPRRAVKGATALSPSPALWSPRRRGQTSLAAAPIFTAWVQIRRTAQSPVGRNVPQVGQRLASSSWKCAPNRSNMCTRREGDVFGISHEDIHPNDSNTRRLIFA
jgi:hypothetical protein